MRTLHLRINIDIPGLTQETRSPLSGIHTDIPEITEKINANSSPQDSHRYPWAHIETRSPLSGIHTDIPEITGKIYTNSSPRDSLRYPRVHIGTRALLSGIHTEKYIRTLHLGIHIDIPGLTLKPELLFVGFTQIFLRSQQK